MAQPNLNPQQFPPGSPQIILTLNAKEDVNIFATGGVTPLRILGALQSAIGMIQHSMFNPSNTPTIVPAAPGDLAALNRLNNGSP